MDINWFKLSVVNIMNYTHVITPTTAALITNTTPTTTLVYFSYRSAWIAIILRL